MHERGPRRSPQFYGDSKTQSPLRKLSSINSLGRMRGLAGTFEMGRSHMRARMRMCAPCVFVYVWFLYSLVREIVPASPRNHGISMSHSILTSGDESRSVPAESPQVPAEINDLQTPCVLYVATDLSTWAPKWPEMLARDCQIDDVVYRRLDPEYFAWLRWRMFAVKGAADAGNVSPEAFDDLRARFNGIQEWAVASLGHEALLAVVGGFNPETYRPPLPEPEQQFGAAEPRPARRNPEAERLARARGLVDEIRDQALAVGWTMDGLYFCDGYERRPFTGKYGLVCYLGAQDRICEVTRESIEIIGPPPAESRMRFYNPDVEQPWIRKTALSQECRRDFMMADVASGQF